MRRIEFGLQHILFLSFDHCRSLSRLDYSRAGEDPTQSQSERKTSQGRCHCQLQARNAARLARRLPMPLGYGLCRNI